MKLALATLVTLMSLTTFAQKYDGDMTEVYLSWCEQQNVVRNDINTATAIVQNCAIEQKVCVMDQKTSGKKVYYRATCEDAPVKYGRDGSTSDQ